MSRLEDQGVQNLTSRQATLRAAALFSLAQAIPIAHEVSMCDAESASQYFPQVEDPSLCRLPREGVGWLGSAWVTSKPCKTAKAFFPKRFLSPLILLASLASLGSAMYCGLDKTAAGLSHGVDGPFVRHITRSGHSMLPLPMPPDLRGRRTTQSRVTPARRPTTLRLRCLRNPRQLRHVYSTRKAAPTRFSSKCLIPYKPGGFVGKEDALHVAALLERYS